MNYKNIKSIMHTSKNEFGGEEVVIERKTSLLRRLFKLPTKKETYVAKDGVWYEKETGKWSKLSTEIEITLRVAELKRRNFELD